MNPKSDTLITVLDAGSSKSCVMVAELADGVLRYRGHGIQPSRGMRKGVISDLGPAAAAINDAALTAERATKALKGIVGKRLTYRSADSTAAQAD